MVEKIHDQFPRKYVAGLGIKLIMVCSLIGIFY